MLRLFIAPPQAPATPVLFSTWLFVKLPEILVIEPFTMFSIAPPSAPILPDASEFDSA